MSFQSPDFCGGLQALIGPAGPKLLCLQLEFKLDRGTEVAGGKASEIEKIPCRFRI